MLENEPTNTDTAVPAESPSDPVAEPAKPRRRRSSSRPAGPPPPADSGEPALAPPEEPQDAAPARPRRTRKKVAAPPEEPPAEPLGADVPAPEPAPAGTATGEDADVAPPPPPLVLFQAPTPVAPPDEPSPRTSRRRSASRPAGEPAAASTAPIRDDEPAADRGTEGLATEIGAEPPQDEAAEAGGAARRRRRRGGRGRRGRMSSEGENGLADDSAAAATPDDAAAVDATAGDAAAEDVAAEDAAGSAAALTDDVTGPGGLAGPADDATQEWESEAAAGAQAPLEGESAAGRRRRRRRRRAGEEVEPSPDDPDVTVVRVRETRPAKSDDEVTSVRGSTRLEAKKQRRREGRDAGRRRPPIVTESEFLARRESVERVMVIRQVADRTQIAVLEDGVLVEHYVSRTAASSLIGNVYLGRVQNVLPSMEAAFVDIGKGRNAVLYAGEVNFDAVGLDGQPRRIEHALKSGQSVLVQVTKDPVGHKGARLTSQISLPGRYLVFVPEGTMTGISRKLPDTERTRLKNALKKVVPDDAGVIIRTAAEGASEEELARDVARLAAQWEDIQKKANTASAPALLYGEPDLTIRVVRDIFNEDFSSLVVAGTEAWDLVEAYVTHVAPDLMERVSRWTEEQDVFAAYRIDEQIAKALDRKVWLPSGGSLVIDRTEAMTVVDVNTGKFTGQGGNLEETVTKNNLEAAEEIVRQLRLRDIGGIIVIDFIDMVLESNRELVLRRLLECLGRDRTKHQVAEVTSLGLVQMTRKRVGQGLLEAFSETCECCGGRGVIVRMDPFDSAAAERGDRSDRRRRRRREAAAAEEAPEEEPVEPAPAIALAEPIEPLEPIAAGAAEEAGPAPEEAPEEALEEAPEEAQPAALSSEQA
jgi:ribonuclease E